MLEYALPSRAYSINAWPSRDSYGLHALTRLQEFHSKYLVRHRYTIIGEVLDLKAFGRNRDHRGNDIARFMLRWSKDCQAVGLERLSRDRYTDSSTNQGLLTMQHFQLWVRTSIEHAQRHLRTLFGTVPPPTLPALDTLIDSFTAQQSGLSFATIQANYTRLEPYMQAFIATAQAQFIQKPGRRHATCNAKPKWKVQAFKAFTDQHVRFLQSLLVVMQQTGGQPVRRPEFLSLKVCNTANSLRNIYVHKGMLCTVVSYNKTNAKTQRVFWVARYLPACVSNILYYYLILVRPLVQHLEKHVPGKRPIADQPYYLWPAKHTLKVEPPSGLHSYESDSNSDSDDNVLNLGVQEDVVLLQRQGFWRTESMSCAIKESSALVGLPFDLTTSSYRQIATGIAKKHLLAQSLRSIAVRKLKDQFGTVTESILHRLFAWQAGHDLEEHVRTYGLDADYPTHLQPELLDLYCTASTTWHEWLELTSITTTIHSAPPFEPVVSRASKHHRITSTKALDVIVALDSTPIVGHVVEHAVECTLEVDTSNAALNAAPNAALNATPNAAPNAPPNAPPNAALNTAPNAPTKSKVTLGLGTKRKHLNVQSRMEPKQKHRLRPKLELELELDNRYTLGPELEHERTPSLEPEPAFNVESSTESEYEPEYEPELESALHVEISTESEFEPEYELEYELEYEPDPEPEPKPKYESKYELEPELEFETEPESEPKPEPEYEPEYELEYEPEYEPKDEPDYEPDYEPEYEPKDEPKDEPNYELEYEPKYK